MGKFFFIAGTPIEYDATEDGYATSFSELPVSTDLASVSYLGSVFGSEITVPVSIFSTDMTAYQVVVKYLKEKHALSNSQIGQLLGRDAKSVWVAYSKVKKSTLPTAKKGDLSIPAAFFSRSSGSGLECLVAFLKSRGLTFAQISRLIRRDQRTVWTAHARFNTKRGESR